MLRYGASCGRVEGACGGATLRTGPRDGAQMPLPPAARVSPDAADPVTVSWGSSIRSCATISIARRGQGANGYGLGRLHDRQRLLGGQEMFVPLVHPPGDAQADSARRSWSSTGSNARPTWSWICRHAFVKAGRDDGFCEGHNAAFHYFGGVPRGIVYDNTKLAVTDSGDGTRQRTQVFSGRTTCSTTASGGRARATTKARWKGWSATPAATGSCRFHTSPVGTR